MQSVKNKTRGFTLIEVLIVIGIIAVLAAIVLIAVNPARQFSKANDAQRASNINAILNALGQKIVDDKGTIDGEITTTVQDISSSGADLCSTLSPTYIPALPSDPKSAHAGAGISVCGSTYDTNYTIVKDSEGRITVTAPDTELGTDISVTR